MFKFADQLIVILHIVKQYLAVNFAKTLKTGLKMLQRKVKSAILS